LRPGWLRVAVATVLLGALAGRAQEPVFDWRQRANVPVWAERLFREQKFRSRYIISYHLNPFYLRGDFNGDGPNDVALLFRALESRRVGIAIFHAGLNQTFIVGGDEDNLPDGVDLRKMEAWTIYEHREVAPAATDERPPRLRGESIFVQRAGVESGLLYWDGTGYRWYPVAP
jgi:hypothetical protein